MAGKAAAANKDKSNVVSKTPLFSSWHNQARLEPNNEMFLREVIVHMDESKKPPVGQGLNKPAEVTLLNIKCFDKKTGHHFTQGPRIDKYKEMLRNKRTKVPNLCHMIRLKGSGGSKSIISVGTGLRMKMMLQMISS